MCTPCQPLPRCAAEIGKAISACGCCPPLPFRSPPGSVEFITEGDEEDQREGKPNLVAAVKVRRRTWWCYSVPSSLLS